MSTPMKALVALNVATLVAVVLLGMFVVVTVNDTSQKVATLAAAIPAGGLASSAEVQDVLAASQETSQAVTDLTAQVASLSTTLGAMQTQLTAIAGAAATPDDARADRSPRRGGDRRPHRPSQTPPDLRRPHRTSAGRTDLRRPHRTFADPTGARGGTRPARGRAREERAAPEAAGPGTPVGR